MPSPFRVRLSLDNFETRLVPSVVAGQEPLSATAATAYEAAKAPYVTIDTQPMFDQVTQLTITVNGDDGSQASVVVSIPAGSTHETQAAYIAAALDAAGVACTVNGTVVSIKGTATGAVESVQVMTTGGNGIGPAHPGISPLVQAYNGATRAVGVNLP